MAFFGSDWIDKPQPELVEIYVEHPERMYTINDVEMFTRWLNTHEIVKKKDYYLYKPFLHENIPRVGWATASKMLKYWDTSGRPNIYGIKTK